MGILQQRGNEDFGDFESTGLIDYTNPVADTVAQTLSLHMDSSNLKNITMRGEHPDDPDKELAIDILQSTLKTNNKLHIFTTFGLGGAKTEVKAQVDGETYSYRTEVWTLLGDMSDRGVQLSQEILSRLAYISFFFKQPLANGAVLGMENLPNKRFAGVMLSEIPTGSERDIVFPPSINHENKLFIYHLYATPITQNELNFLQEQHSDNRAQELNNFLVSQGEKAYSHRRQEFTTTTNKTR